MTVRTLATDHLILQPMTAEMIEALIVADEERLSALTGATFPTPVKPPPLFEDALPFLLDQIRSTSDLTWVAPRLLVRPETGEAVGGAGFSPPDPEGTVQNGYAVYPEHVGRGYATEAVRALGAWALEQPGVARVVATIPPWNRASIRVVEKAGWHLVGTDEDDEVGTILVYELSAVHHTAAGSSKG